MCGDTVLSLVESDLNFIILICEDNQCEINLNPTSEDQVGSYEISFRAYLEDYEEVEDATHKPSDL